MKLQKVLSRLPWRFAVRHLARSHGFLDPMLILSQLQKFAQPAEVAESTELLRAGVIFHARGLLNVKAIQHNLDWVWPYWVQRQFDPRDPSFIPRAFSITHVNLTHRNWTAVGLPGLDWFPIVDERGLLTPHWDSWSVDTWVLPVNEAEEIGQPQKAERVEQRLQCTPEPVVDTVHSTATVKMQQRIAMELRDGLPVCVQKIKARSAQRALLVVAIRPYNPEGVSFIDRIEYTAADTRFQVNGTSTLELGAVPNEVLLSEYRHGDVLHTLTKAHPNYSSKARSTIECDVGMATAAAVYTLEPGEDFSLHLTLPHSRSDDTGSVPKPVAPGTSAETLWKQSLKSAAQLEIPEIHLQEMYQAALTTLVLLTPETAYPGPYTYKRFWCRDAAFIANALLVGGLLERFPPIISKFAEKQLRNGHFCSQDGEWDSNGQVLWTIGRYLLLSGKTLSEDQVQMLERGADWIANKLLPNDGTAHAGLLPPGFSAEHLGPNDYYYWDDFWSIAGLETAAEALDRLARPVQAVRFRALAKTLRASVEKSLTHAIAQNHQGAIPAAPYRRLDAGAIGSVAADYPCQVYSPGDRRVMATVEFLLQKCSINNAFFQDMIHSGFNAYLTLHLAQVLLRAGDPRYLPLLDRVVEMASSTGQWPEAIHPLTGGGCMGDGQHAWAAAELVLLLRTMFVHEEGSTLVLFSGVPERWRQTGERLAYGPTPTKFGLVSVSLQCSAAGCEMEWNVDWTVPPEAVVIALPNAERQTLTPDVRECTLPNVVDGVH